MPHCSSCGVQVTQGAQYCPDCGEEVTTSNLEPEGDTIEMWYPEENAVLEPVLTVLLALFLFQFVSALNVGGGTIGIVVLVLLGVGAVSGYQKLFKDTRKSFDTPEAAQSFIEDNPPESPNVIISIALVIGGFVLFFYSQNQVAESLASLLGAIGIGAASSAESGFLGFLFWLFMIIVSVGMVATPLDTLIVHFIRQQQRDKIPDTDA